MINTRTIFHVYKYEGNKWIFVDSLKNEQEARDMAEQRNKNNKKQYRVTKIDMTEIANYK